MERQWSRSIVQPVDCEMPDGDQPSSDEVLEHQASTFDNSDHVQNQAGVQTFNGPVRLGSVHTTHITLDRNTRRPESKTVELLLDPEEKRKYLLRSLEFSQIDSRLDAVKVAHADTCRWLLDQEEYKAWLDDTQLERHHGILWIKGKPATSKSTIVKFALIQSQKNADGTKVISFFFGARGDLLEKTALGLFRSLLAQLLHMLPDLQNVLDDCFVSADSVDPDDAKSYQWSVEKLKQLFRSAVEQLRQRKVICFLDALDECEEDETRDMVKFFEVLCRSVISSGIGFRVCLSSRHHPHITVRNSVQFVLERQAGHRHDIAVYLTSELQIYDVGNRQAEQIRTDILERSSGIFLWVVLVVRILNKEYDHGRVHLLQQRLNEIPNDTEALFHDILTRDGQPGNELVLCIQWVLFAKRPLNLEELYFAILTGLDIDNANRLDSVETSPEIMTKFLLYSSKGLIEETKSQPRRMQFIHESVRDFLRRGTGLQSDLLGPPETFEARSHERLKQCCYLYHLKSDAVAEDHNTRRSSIASSRSTSPGKMSDANMRDVQEDRHLPSHDHIVINQPTKNPFLSDYAMPYLLYHSERAHEQGLCQRDFVRAFDLSKWLRWHNSLSQPTQRRYSEAASLLYVLAAENLPHLVTLELEVVSNIEIPGEQYGSPLYVAQRNGHDKVLTAFMSATPLPEPINHQKRGLLSKREIRKAVHSLRRSVYEIVDWYPPLLWAIAYAEPEVAKCLLVGGRVSVNPDYQNKTQAKQLFRPMPLHFAVERGHTETVRLLLTYENINVNATDVYVRTPLHLAALYGRVKALELLLEHEGLNVNAVDVWGQTPLHVAIESHHDDVVKVLLSKQMIDVNTQDPCGRTPLSSAVEFNSFGIVEMLLARVDVDIDLPDGKGMTPLCIARLHGWRRIATLLQSHGAISSQQITVTMR